METLGIAVTHYSLPIRLRYVLQITYHITFRITLTSRYVLLLTLNKKKTHHMQSQGADGDGALHSRGGAGWVGPAIGAHFPR